MFESFIGVNFWTALFVLLNTIALFLVLKKKLFVPVKKMIDDRQKEIDDMYQSADEAQRTAMALETEYKQKLSVRTVARQVLLSMEFFRQEYWGGLPFPSPGDLSDPGIEPGAPAL